MGRNSKKTKQCLIRHFNTEKAILPNLQYTVVSHKTPTIPCHFHKKLTVQVCLLATEMPAPTIDIKTTVV